jgi:hypothetical protein
MVIFFAVEFLMDDRPVQPNNSDPQVDEAVVERLDQKERN